MSIITTNYQNTKTMVENCIEAMDYKVVAWYSFILALGNAADSIGIMCVGYILSSLNHVLTSEQKSWIGASIFIGMFVGGLMGGKFADIWGRRFYLLLSYIITLIAFICTYITSLYISDVSVNDTSHIKFLVINCVVCGIGVGSFIPIIFALGSELFPSQYRGKLLTVIASFWMVGSIYTALIGWILLGNDINGDKMIPSESGGNWRTFILVCSIPVLLGLILTYVYIPESPSFVLNDTYSKIHLSNDQKIGIMSEYMVLVNAQVWNMQLNFDPHESTNERIQYRSSGSEHRRRHCGSENSIENADCITNIDGDSKLYSGLSVSDVMDAVQNNNRNFGNDGDFTRSHSVRSVATVATTNHNMWVLSIVWFCLNFSTSGILLWVNIVYEHIGIYNVYGTSLVYALASLPGAMFGYYYIDIIGRHSMLFNSMIVAAVSVGGIMVGILGFNHYKENPTSIGDFFSTLCLITSSVVFSASSIAGWNALETLSAESFPSSIRPTSVGILTAWARVGAIVAQFIFGALEHHVLWLLLCACFSLLVGGICGHCVPDTTGILLTHTDELSNLSVEDLAMNPMNYYSNSVGNNENVNEGGQTTVKSVVIGDEVTMDATMDIPLVVNQSSHRNAERSLISVNSMRSNASVAI